MHVTYDLLPSLMLARVKRCNSNAGAVYEVWFLLQCI